MKNLIFKEIKLSIHPLTYLMMALILLASLSGLGSFYPISLFGVLYTFLFIGIKKGVSSNDLLYTVSLPVRREDVVTARVISTTFLQIIFLGAVVLLSFLNGIIPNQEAFPSIGFWQLMPLIGVTLICYTIYDLIYMPWFYSNGKSVVANLFVGMFVVGVVSFGMTFIPTKFPEFMEMITIGNAKANYLLQISILLFSLSIYILFKVINIKICTKKLLKLDF